jgi:hypothetical protein
MLEVLQFYVSGFWTWLGITIGLGIVAKLILGLVLGSLAAAKGGSVRIE